MQHLLTKEARDAGIHDMESFYGAIRVCATSEIGDIACIRSHIAYWCGQDAASRAAIRPSRGHGYRVARCGKHGTDDLIVRVPDPYDHRDGVQGFRD